MHYGRPDCRPRQYGVTAGGRTFAISPRRFHLEVQPLPAQWSVVSHQTPNLDDRADAKRRCELTADLVRRLRRVALHPLALGGQSEMPGG